MLELCIFWTEGTEFPCASTWGKWRPGGAAEGEDRARRGKCGRGARRPWGPPARQIPRMSRESRGALLRTSCCSCGMGHKKKVGVELLAMGAAAPCLGKKGAAEGGEAKGKGLRAHGGEEDLLLAYTWTLPAAGEVRQGGGHGRSCCRTSRDLHQRRELRPPTQPGQRRVRSPAWASTA